MYTTIYVKHWMTAKKFVQYFVISLKRLIGSGTVAYFISYLQQALLATCTNGLRLIYLPDNRE